MKVEIEIEDKYVNAAIAQVELTDEFDKETIEMVKEKCRSETIKVNPEDFGKEDAINFKLGLAMMAVGIIGEEIENSSK